jgi:Asp-tRNA(Asn)/Glu-tRNA(Gln) amidotransferase A subunit family amidase
VAVKDLFHMAGLPTTAGNPTWLATHAIPEQTASSVVMLLAAGAEFVGKTITDELAYSLNGQNIHYGTPTNPITAERLPGGSSSGSAVAVAAGLADIGLGTDTGGSIRVPASYNGLFGLRPTHGRIPMDNMVRLAPSFDTVGVLARDLDTLEKTIAVLLADTSEQPLPITPTVKIAHLQMEQVEHRDLLQAKIAQWHQCGKLGELHSLTIDTDAWQTGEAFRVLQGAEIWAEHGDWIETHQPEFAPDIEQRLRWTQTLLPEDVLQVKQRQTAFTDWLDGHLANGLLLLPTTPGLAPLIDTPDAELADYRNQLLAMTAIAGLGGYPQLHLPIADIDGAPCGLSLLGPRNSDLALIAFAKSLLE